MSIKNKFRARFRKVSTGEEIWQFASLFGRGLCNPYDNLNGRYIQVSDWEQYTGKKDMEGNDVFEGDIIKTIIEKEWMDGINDLIIHEVVEWDKEDAAFIGRTISETRGVEKGQLFTNESIIIGNIHEKSF